MEKEIIFVILDKYPDWEGAYAAYAITTYSQGTYMVKTASITKDPVISAGGFTARPNYGIAEIPKNYAGIILVGGTGWAADRESAEKFAPIVMECAEEHRLLGGICGGADFLAKCGVLNNVYHTGNSLKELERYAGSAYTGSDMFQRAQAVRDGQIVTANSSAALEFARAIMSALSDVNTTGVDAWFKMQETGVAGRQPATMAV